MDPAYANKQQSIDAKKPGLKTGLFFGFFIPEGIKIKMVGRPRFERGTIGLKVRCSTS